MPDANGKLRIALVGLRFGAAFVPIYLDHPDVSEVTICDANEATLNLIGDKHKVERRYRSLDEVLADASIDAVHLVTPIHAHAKMSVRVLESGKHCACTVPMGTSVDELREIVRAERRSGCNYMMMETAVYTYHCFRARGLIDDGTIGRVQFLRGAHYQDMENWPEYWMGLPPMHYATHAIAPLMWLTGARATRVHCFGSGKMREELVARHGNPWPIETSIFRFDRDDLAAEVTRTLFHTAHPYGELFSLYGERGTFDWQYEHDNPRLFTVDTQRDSQGRSTNKLTTTPVALQDYAQLLPESIRKYTQLVEVPDPKNPHQSIRQGGHHHGAHPHMVHEFVRSIVERRSAASNAVIAANWTAAGICAHESAMNEGVGVEVPDFGEVE